MYEGKWKHGKRNGKGKFTCANGAVYEGDWKDGKMNGEGKRTFPDGAVYDGEWKDDKWHGKGKYTSPDGKASEGEWKDGKRHQGNVRLLMEQFVRGDGRTRYSEEGGGSILTNRGIEGKLSAWRRENDAC